VWWGVVLCCVLMGGGGVGAPGVLDIEKNSQSLFTGAMSAFAQFYGRNARLPGPLSRGGAEGVAPGVLAPPPNPAPWGGPAAPAVGAASGAWVGSEHPSGLVWAGSQAPAREHAEASAWGAGGLDALRPAGEWAAAGGADAWARRWAARGTQSGAAAVEGVAAGAEFGALFLRTECLRYAESARCELHGAPVLPDSQAALYAVDGARRDFTGRPVQVERCGCGKSSSRTAP
jgi:hypothetical protein